MKVLLTAMMCAAAASSSTTPTPVTAQNFTLVSSTTISTPNSVITCDESAPNWPVINLLTPLGAGLTLDAANKLFSVDAAYQIVARGTARLNTCYGANDVCYAGQQSNTFRILDATTKARLASLASVSGSGTQLRTSPVQTIPNTTFSVAAGSSFGLVFSTTFCDWVDWSLTGGLTLDVYRAIVPTAPTPPTNSPTTPTRSPTLPTTSPTLPSKSPTPAPPTPAPYSLVSSTTFTIPTSGTTCDARNPNWVVLRPQGTLGYGLSLNSASNRLNLDSRVVYIRVSGSANFETCYGANGACYSSRAQLSNALSVFSSAPSVSLLGDLARVVGTGVGVSTAPTQTIPFTTVSVSNVNSIGFAFVASFCDWVGWSQSSGVTVEVYMRNAPAVLPAATYSPTAFPAFQDTAPAPTGAGSAGSSTTAAVAAGVSVGVVVVGLGVAGVVFARRRRARGAASGRPRRDEPNFTASASASASAFATTLRQHVGGSQRFGTMPPSPPRSRPTAPPPSVSSPSSSSPSSRNVGNVGAVPVAAVVSDAVSESSRQFIPVASEAAVGDVSKV